MHRVKNLTAEDLNLILRTIGDGITIQGPDGNLLYANDAAARLIGAPSADALLSRSTSEIMSAFEILDEQGQALPSTAIPSRKALEGIRAEQLVRFRIRATGEERWSRHAATPTFGPDGSVQLVINIFQDVTEKQQAEEALRREQERLRFIEDAMGRLGSSLDWEATLQAVAQLAVPHIADWCGIELVQEDGSVKQVAVAHVDPEKVALAKELSRRYPPPPDAPFGVPAVLRSGKTEWAGEIPEQLLAQAWIDDGQRQIIRSLGLRAYIVAPMIAAGRVMGVISFVAAERVRTFTDKDVRLAEALAERAAVAIDNARLYREAAQATRLREQLLAIVSHDLRNPLAAISMSAGRLKRKLLDNPDLARTADRIDASADRMERLINQLLDFSRASSGGGLPLQRRDVALNELCRNVVDELRTAHPGAQVTLHEGAELRGAWDGDRLGEVLSNLVGNAIQHGQQSPVSLRLSHEAEHAVVTVHNDGEPIVDDLLPHLFDPFRRGSEERKGGAGLGLYIARWIVEAHGGQIEVLSNAGHGTTFTVRLPLKPSHTLASDREAI